MNVSITRHILLIRLMEKVGVLCKAAAMTGTALAVASNEQGRNTVVLWLDRVKYPLITNFIFSQSLVGERK